MKKISIIQTSIPSSGTMIFANIIMALTNLSLFLDKESIFLRNLAEQSSIFYKDKNVGFARLANINFNEDGSISTGVLYYEESGELLFSKEIDITDMYEKILLSEENYFFLTHSFPNDIDCCKVDASTKKIYVLRDFREAFHSHIRSVDKNENNSMELKKIFSKKEDIQLAKYLDIEEFLSFLYAWKKHVQAYLDRQDQYILVRYDTLMQNPIGEILRIAKELEISIEENKVSDICGKYLHKDVWLYGKTSAAFAHYNSKSTDSWNRYFSSAMLNIVEKEIGHLLSYFGYQSVTNSVQSSEIQLCLDNIYSNYSFVSMEVMISRLDNMLSDESIVFYGAGEYLRLLSRKLSKFERTKFIVDDSTEKNGRKICGIEICGSDQLIIRFKEFDKILIAADKKHQDLIYKKLETINIPADKVINIFSRSIYFLLKEDCC